MANFQFMSINAEALDAPGFWYGGDSYAAVGPNGYGPIGGPAGNNIFGVAQLFNVSEPLSISALQVQAVLGQGSGTATFSYKLYTGTAIKNNEPVPDNSTLVLTSEPLMYTKTEESMDVSMTPAPTKQIAFEITLQPGKYWLAQEGNPGGPAVYINHTYEPSHSRRVEVKFNKN